MVPLYVFLGSQLCELSDPIKLNSNLHWCKSCPYIANAKDEGTFQSTISEQFLSMSSSQDKKYPGPNSSGSLNRLKCKTLFHT